MAKYIDTKKINWNQVMTKKLKPDPDFVPAITKQPSFKGLGKCWGCDLYCGLMEIQYLDGHVMKVCSYCEAALHKMAVALVAKKPSIHVVRKALMLQARKRNVRIFNPNKRKRVYERWRKDYERFKNKNREEP